MLDFIVKSSECGGIATANPHHKPTDVYCCKTYKLSNSKFNTICSPHHISTSAARDIILAAIRTTVGYVRDYEQEPVNMRSFFCY